LRDEIETNQEGWVQIKNILPLLKNTPVNEVAKASFESN
jgi:hypothetical protein